MDFSYSDIAEFLCEKLREYEQKDCLPQINKLIFNMWNEPYLAGVFGALFQTCGDFDGDFDGRVHINGCGCPVQIHRNKIKSFRSAELRQALFEKTVDLWGGESVDEHRLTEDDLRNIAKVQQKNDELIGVNRISWFLGKINDEMPFAEFAESAWNSQTGDSNNWFFDDDD